MSCPWRAEGYETRLRQICLSEIARKGESEVPPCGLAYEDEILGSEGEDRGEMDVSGECVEYGPRKGRCGRKALAVVDSLNMSARGRTRTFNEPWSIATNLVILRPSSCRTRTGTRLDKATLRHTPCTRKATPLSHICTTLTRHASASPPFHPLSPPPTPDPPLREG